MESDASREAECPAPQPDARAHGFGLCQCEGGQGADVPGTGTSPTARRVGIPAAAIRHHVLALGAPLAIEPYRQPRWLSAMKRLSWPSTATHRRSEAAPVAGLASPTEPPAPAAMFLALAFPRVVAPLHDSTSPRVSLFCLRTSVGGIGSRLYGISPGSSVEGAERCDFRLRIC